MSPLLRVVALVVMLGIALWLIAQLGFVVGTFTIGIILFGGLTLADAAVTSGSMTDDWIRPLPIIGSLYIWLLKPATYYRIDTMEMFQRSVHNAVLEVIDGMTAEKGIKALSESDRKPIMRELYSRKGA